MVAMTRWASAFGLEMELVEAGLRWDAVRMPAVLGCGVGRRLGDACGAVVHDSCADVVYFLVSPGTAAGWELYGESRVVVLGSGSWVAVPPRGGTGTRRVRWARTGTDEGSPLTDAPLLYGALASALVDEDSAAAATVAP